MVCQQVAHTRAEDENHGRSLKAPQVFRTIGEDEPGHLGAGALASSGGHDHFETPTASICLSRAVAGQMGRGIHTLPPPAPTPPPINRN